MKGRVERSVVIVGSGDDGGVLPPEAMKEPLRHQLSLIDERWPVGVSAVDDDDDVDCLSSPSLIATT